VERRPDQRAHALVQDADLVDHHDAVDELGATAIVACEIDLGRHWGGIGWGRFVGHGFLSVGRDARGSAGSAWPTTIDDGLLL
jgi:hypothetical protein